MKRLETLYELLTQLPDNNDDLIICITPQSRKELIKEIKAFKILNKKDVSTYQIKNYTWDTIHDLQECWTKKYKITKKEYDLLKKVLGQ